MANKILFTALEVRLVSLVDLDLFEARPTPSGLDEAEYRRRLFARSLKLLAAGKQVHELLKQQGPYAAEAAARILDEACRGL